MHRSTPRLIATVRTVTLLLACMLTGSLLAAQATSAGTVTGTVTDPTGATIEGATITITDLSTKEKRTTQTSKDGQYVLVNIPPGDYAVGAAKIGFAQDQVPSLSVRVATQTTANFMMTVGSENTTISVEISNADLQTLNATTGVTVDPAMVESLPAIGRDVATFLTMQPGVTPGGSVAGTTVDQATFQLDGGSNSSDMDGTQGVYTTSFANSTTGGFIAAGPGGVMPMPQDSIEEFKVSTSGQTADFNNSSGSQSQVVTKRGREHWHGTIYEYYLDSNIGANTWQNNFPGTGYTAKPSYHYSRFGAAAGGPVLPYMLGGKTYLFANYEGFRYPAAATYERDVPSYEFLQLGQLTFGGTTYSAAQLAAADPRHIGQNRTLKNFYNTQLPVSPAGNAGSTGANGATYAGIFDKSCGPLSGAICDSVNIIGYRANVLIPQSSNFLATRADHDFGAKWHLTASYRYYKITSLTSNQVDIGGVLPGTKIGVPTAVSPRPQDPWYFVVGLTTNISTSLTNDFHYSYLRNFWQWKGAGAPPQITGAGGAIEPLGESSTNVLSPYNVNAQNIRTRIWDGKDNFFRDDLTKLAGNHLIQFGGQFQHNFNYHQRTDNGASINYTPTYQIGDTGGGGNVAYTGLASVGANTAAYARILDTYFGIVTDTQVANTYANKGGTLTLNPSNTAISANTSIPYYNLYVTDTWHLKPSVTFSYGLGYAIEMPPSERDGNQVMFTDATGNAIHIQDYLNSRKSAALQGQIFNPQIGFALIKNVVGAPKYPYNPYYGAVSPRISFAWNPKFDSGSLLGKVFGDGATVLRAGYGRLYGRINGDVQVLNPLLSPGLILATQCKYAQSPITGSGGCTQPNFNDTTVFRFGNTTDGLDGLSPTLAGAALPSTLAQPYRPGIDGPGVQIASPVDPGMKPNNVDTFNVSIQRQINRRMLVEVGYIGRLIHNEYIMQNPNAVPYMLSLGGQSFTSAYQNIEAAFGCTISAAECSKRANPAATIAAQPFFEAALGGPNSTYCVKFTSCTQAMLSNTTLAGHFRNQRIFNLWQALDNNTLGVGNGGLGFVFPRSLMGTPTGNATYGSAGQVGSGLTVGTANGYSNYHGGYVSFKASNFHGLTLQENLTWSKALGLGAFNQSTSSIAAEDSFNLHQQYGRQGFDQRIILNTFVVYETPWYRNQNGIIGRLAGGWTLSPVVAAGTGQPLTCTTNNSGQNFGGNDGSTLTDNENCIFLSNPASGHTTRGIIGGTVATSNGNVSVGTNPKGPGGAAVNMFADPVSVYANVRPPILGIDQRDGGVGSISGLAYLNLDLSVRKRMVIYEKYSLEFSGIFYNFMNHLDFANPSLSLQSTTNWGTTKTQGNSPRQIQMGLRANF